MNTRSRTRLRRGTPALALLGALAIVGVPAAEEPHAADWQAFRWHFLLSSVRSLAAPLDRDLRRDCTCVPDALAVVPSSFAAPGTSGAGVALQPAEAIARAHLEAPIRAADPEVLRNQLSRLLAGSSEPENGWQFSRVLLGFPDALGLAPDTAVMLAAHYLSRAAHAGHQAAQGEFGYLHLVGWGVPQSDAQAAHWFERSARGGHVPAQLAIAAMYALGRGVERSEATAFSWFEHAGDARLLGDAYACGLGVEPDMARAIKVYERGAGAADGDAQERLASLYANACGAPLDEAKALALYEDAAQSGHPAAQIALSELLLRTPREGVPTPIPAYMWAELAFVRLPEGPLRRRAEAARAQAGAMLGPAGRQGAAAMARSLLKSAQPTGPAFRRDGGQGAAVPRRPWTRARAATAIPSCRTA